MNKAVLKNLKKGDWGELRSVEDKLDVLRATALVADAQSIFIFGWLIVLTGSLIGKVFIEVLGYILLCLGVWRWWVAAKAKFRVLARVLPSSAGFVSGFVGVDEDGSDNVGRVVK